jgi:hypothetical protein
MGKGRRLKGSTRPILRFVALAATNGVAVTSVRAQSAEEVAAANNPLAPITAINLQNYYVPAIYDSPDSSANSMLVRAVVAVSAAAGTPASTATPASTSTIASMSTRIATAAMDTATGAAAITRWQPRQPSRRRRWSPPRSSGRS